MYSVWWQVIHTNDGCLPFLVLYCISYLCCWYYSEVVRSRVRHIKTNWSSLFLVLFLNFLNWKCRSLSFVKNKKKPFRTCKILYFTINSKAWDNIAENMIFVYLQKKLKYSSTNYQYLYELKSYLYSAMCPSRFNNTPYAFLFRISAHPHL